MPIAIPSAVPPPIVASIGDVGVDAPCAGIGAHLRCFFDDVSAAPLPNRLAELTAKLEAARAAAGVRRRT